MNPYMACEIAAQAYMMSAEFRRCAQALPPPERLQMLYRLQAGQRTPTDVDVLKTVLDQSTNYSLALSVYRSNVLEREDAQIRHLREAMVSRRRLRARDGDYSRQELNSRRRETANTESNRAMAIAAGRRAMQNGPALVEQAGADPHRTVHESMLDSVYGEVVDEPHFPDADVESPDEGDNSTDETNSTDVEDFGVVPGLTNARFNPSFAELRPLVHGEARRMRGQPGFSRLSRLRDQPLNSSTLATDRGLDASTTRPEPKGNDELRVQMECKICYTQLSEVACLPCGHLVMCRWCSEQHSPCLPHDRTKPRLAAQCPVCRKGIRQKVRVYRA